MSAVIHNRAFVASWPNRPASDFVMIIDRRAIAQIASGKNIVANVVPSSLLLPPARSGLDPVEDA